MGVTIAVGAVIGAVGGAAMGSAQGGDAIWKGALAGAVGGAVGGAAFAPAGGALGATFGNVAGGAMSGALGGIASGALGTALNGGNSGDYLRNMSIGGLTGAAMGGLGGYASGEFGAGVPTGTEGATPTTPTVDTSSGQLVSGTSPVANTDVSSLTNTGAQGAGQGTLGNTSVPTSNVVTPTAQATAGATGEITNAPQLSNIFAANNTNTMTDIGGSSAIPQELPGGVDLNGNSTTPAPSLASLGQQGQSQAMNSMKAFDLGGANWGEGQTLAPTPNTSMMPSTQVGNQSPANWWDTLGGSLKKAGTGMMIGQGLKGVGGILGGVEAQQNKSQLMDLYNQQNTRNQQLADQYQQTLTNPQAYLNGPEAQAARSAELQQAMRMNAAAGKRNQYSALANAMQQSQLQNLYKYRASLQTPQYGQAATTLGNAQAQSPVGNVMAGLGGMFAPTYDDYIRSVLAARGA